MTGVQTCALPIWVTVGLGAPLVGVVASVGLVVGVAAGAVVALGFDPESLPEQEFMSTTAPTARTAAMITVRVVRICLERRPAAAVCSRAVRALSFWRWRLAAVDMERNLPAAGNGSAAAGGRR